MNPAFERYIGIDYSGAQTPKSCLKGLRVYEADRLTTAHGSEPAGISKGTATGTISDGSTDTPGDDRIPGMRDAVPLIISVASFLVSLASLSRRHRLCLWHCLCRLRLIWLIASRQPHILLNIRNVHAPLAESQR